MNNQVHVCLACKQPITQGTFTVLPNNTAYHADCFCCYQCGKVLPAKYVMFEGKYLHSECYAMKFAEKCAKCDLPTRPGEQLVSIGGKLLHSTCFTCFLCRKPLNGKYYEKDGQMYDIQCFTDRYAPKCSVCKTGISMDQQYSKVGANNFHTHCFNCITCKKSLVGLLFKDCGNGTFECQDCVRKPKPSNAAPILTSAPVAPFASRNTPPVSANSSPSLVNKHMAPVSGTFVPQGTMPNVSGTSSFSTTNTQAPSVSGTKPSPVVNKQASTPSNIFNKQNPSVSGNTPPEIVNKQTHPVSSPKFDASNNKAPTSGSYNSPAFKPSQGLNSLATITTTSASNTPVSVAPSLLGAPPQSFVSNTPSPVAQEIPPPPPPPPIALISESEDKFDEGFNVPNRMRSSTFGSSTEPSNRTSVASSIGVPSPSAQNLLDKLKDLTGVDYGQASDHPRPKSSASFNQGKSSEQLSNSTTKLKLDPSENSTPIKPSAAAQGPLPSSLLNAIKSTSQENLKKLAPDEIRDASTPAFLRENTNTALPGLADAVKKMSVSELNNSDIQQAITKTRIAVAENDGSDDDW